MNQPSVPVAWTQERMGRWVGRLVRPRPPAVLVLSLPRSGSSWTGEALGAAANALYLREPVTQSDKTFYRLGTVFALDRPDLEARYRRLADKAYAGWPDFGSDVVRFPAQWSLGRRRGRRVVIKEVNPLACGWYARHYQPRIVFLVRHPAAVALSWQGRGWLEPSADAWAANGRAQGHALREALTALESYPAHRLVVYEDLCASPLAELKRLFEFAQLRWDQSGERFIAERISENNQANTWDTSRNSQHMIHGWRERAVQAHVDALRTTYREFDVPWYREDPAWVV